MQEILKNYSFCNYFIKLFPLKLPHVVGTVHRWGNVSRVSVGAVADYRGANNRGGIAECRGGCVAEGRSGCVAERRGGCQQGSRVGEAGFWVGGSEGDGQDGEEGTLKTEGRTF